MRRLAAVAILIVGLAWAQAHAQNRICVDYYYIPHCMSCSLVLHSLAELSAELGDRVDIHTVDCFSDQGKAAARIYGFVTHGIVVSVPTRGIIFLQKDHGVSAADVGVVVRKELAR